MSSYDQSLLGKAPEATRVQAGYDVNLLDQPPWQTPSVHSAFPPKTIWPHTVPIPLAPVTTDAGSGEKLGSAASTPAATTSHTSFWRSRNGIIAIAVVVLIVIGTVLGSAVGTIKKSSNVNSETNNATPSNSGPPITITSPTTLSQHLGGPVASNSGPLTTFIATTVAIGKTVSIGVMATVMVGGAVE